MKSLQTIQKIFRVFHVLTKIAMILSFIWAGLAALVAGILLAWFGGSLFQVAVLACAVVFVLELVL